MSNERKVPALLGLLCSGVLLAAAGCSGSGRATEPTPGPDVVAVYGDERLTLAEFEERYARSAGSREAAADDSLAAYQEFLDRYVNFRLKVLAAEAAGLDEAPSILEEIQTYRTNLARPYLLEQEVLDPIVRDLYTKRQQIVDVSHILIRVSDMASPADSLAAYEKIAALADSLAAGADFGDLAFRHSQDPSARGRENAPGYRGRLGYFSAGRVVQPFEDMAYATPVGATSPVFRTEFGYHILKVHDRRPAVQDVHVAHIMIRPEPTAEDSARALELARELKQRVEAGEDFAALAREHSADRGSAQNGGDLGFISYEMPIVAPFKDAAFALDEPGEISDVVETNFGYHVIKFFERKPVQTYEEAHGDLKEMAARMPRAQEAERALAHEILAANGAQIDTTFLLAAFEGVAVDSVIARLVEQDFSADTLNRVFFTLGDSSYTLADLTLFARGARFSPEAETRDQVLNFLDQFAVARAIDFEAATLDRRDDEFRRVMEEFRDGLVLFKLMEDSVWTAAERDSAALVAYYEAHRDDYRFPDRTRIVGLHSRSDSVLTALAARLDAGTALASLVAEIAADTLSTVRVDTVLAAGETGSIYDQALALAPGAHTAPIRNRGVFVLLVNDGTDPARPKTFDEARAEVVGQYQQVLESELLQRLRQRFAVRLYPERLTRAFEGTPGAAATAADQAMGAAQAPASSN